MNLDFSDEQKMLQSQARTFLSDKSSLSVCRSVLEGEEPFARELWQGMAELGWMATTIPEAYGGVGLGYLELCVLAQELGRHLSPVPYSSTMYLATEGLLLAASDSMKQQYLPQIAEGKLIGTLAVYEQAGGLQADTINTRVEKDKLTGGKVMVPDGDVADFTLVLAQDGDSGLSLFLVDLTQDGVMRQTMETMDPSRSHARLQMEAVACERLGKKGSGLVLIEKIFDRASVLFGFEQIGGCEAALKMSKAYALERYTFGRPIGSYQAIKHKLAKMFVETSLAKSNCYYGAWALSQNNSELSLAAATARVSSIKAFKECAEENIQTHGGNGFTWEYDCHLFYRRAKLLALNIGSEMVWKDKIVNCLENELH